MARKTGVSFVVGMMVDAVIKGLNDLLRQVALEFFVVSIRIAAMMKVNEPPRTASHEQAKKATTHGFPSNTARTRRKKRRDVSTITIQ